MNEFKTENKPFVLIARIHVKPGNVDQYLEIAAKVDAEVENSEPLDAKLKILENEKSIIEQSNLKFQEENEILKNENNILSNKILNLNNEISSQKKTINQFNVNKEELKFLKLNLQYGHKCRRSFFNNKGFMVGSNKYKNCVLNKGRINNG